MALTGTNSLPSQTDAAIICDVLWALAPMNMGLEHVTVIPAMYRIDVVFFLPHDATNPTPQIRTLLNEVRRGSAGNLGNPHIKEVTQFVNLFPLK
jgi:hypothetical protein